jgi:hypothetical protein
MINLPVEVCREDVAGILPTPCDADHISGNRSQKTGKNTTNRGQGRFSANSNDDIVVERARALFPLGGYGNPQPRPATFEHDESAKVQFSG